MDEGNLIIIVSLVSIVLFIFFILYLYKNKDYESVKPDIYSAWKESNYDTGEQTEQGGVIYKTTEGLKVIRFKRENGVRSSMTNVGKVIQDIRDKYEILYVFHSHPFAPHRRIVESDGDVSFPTKTQDIQIPSTADYDSIQGKEMGMLLTYGTIIIYSKKGVEDRISDLKLR